MNRQERETELVGRLEVLRAEARAAIERSKQARAAWEEYQQEYPPAGEDK